MKQFGYLLLIGGFLAAAYATALDTRATEWALFLPAAVAGIAGVAAINRSSRGLAHAASLLTENRAELAASLQRIVEQTDAMAAGAEGMDVDRVRAEIDLRLREPLRRFAEARESLVHLYGLQAYADIMSGFAAGERYLNRAWSASADGYAEESLASLDKAAERFRAAVDLLQAAAGKAGDTGSA
jgi:hypothetical protein